jgi:hypothetical protein
LWPFCFIIKCVKQFQQMVTISKLICDDQVSSFQYGIPKTSFMTISFYNSVTLFSFSSLFSRPNLRYLPPMTKLENSSYKKYHSVTKVSNVMSKLSEIATFLVVFYKRFNAYRLSQYEPLDCSCDRSDAAEGLLSWFIEDNKY